MPHILKRLAYVGVGALACFSSSTLAQQAPTAPVQTYLPRYQFKAGAEQPYLMNMEVSGDTIVQGQSYPMLMVQNDQFDQGYRNISADGMQADIALQIVSATMSMNGRPRSFTADELVDLQAGIPKLRMRTDGTLVSSPGAAASAVPTMQGMQGAILPPAPVPIGGAWSSAYVVQGQQFIGRYVLESVAMDPKFHQIMTIDVTLKGQSVPGGKLTPNVGRLYIAAQGSGELHFDNTLGILRDSTVTTTSRITTEPRQPGQKPVHGTLVTKFTWKYAPDPVPVPAQ